MGSSGSGTLSDYSKSTGSSKPEQASGGDPCKKAFSDALEEVDRCEYFTQHHSVPAVGTPVTVRLGKRLEVLSPGMEIIGYLPTARNYLAACIASGISYAGVVANSRLRPVSYVSVDILPI